MSSAQLDLALEQRGYDFDAELAALAQSPAASRGPAVRAALARSRVALALTQPQPVTLVGRQNAGKSTLLNLLLFRERALTGDTPGLTRDPVSERTTLGGYPYELIDTAGEGVAPTPLDAAAIERGRARRAGAMVVVVVDGAVGPHPDDLELLARSALVVRSKQDLPQADWPRGARCDGAYALTQQPAQEVRAAFGALLSAARGLPEAAPVGGFAALDQAQLSRLQALEVDGTDAPSSA
jgi:tRNA U34 5-carboxymethylaminomethyl modifying GTPase MnmE/TrmE